MVVSALARAAAVESAGAGGCEIILICYRCDERGGGSVCYVGPDVVVTDTVLISWPEGTLAGVLINSLCQDMRECL